MALLEIDGLSVAFGTGRRPLVAVDGVDCTIDAGEIVGVVGESGSGKTVMALAVMGLVDFPGKVRARRMTFAGRDLLALSGRERRALVGKDMAMIFQDPLASLDPCYTVAYQLGEALRVHGTREEQASARLRRAKALALLQQVEIPDAAARLSAYPHQLSGGMAQRVMIAMAIACHPKLLIADEPSTALDVTVQAQILDLLVRLQREHDMALLLITHDLAVVAETAQRVMVMYAAQAFETGPVPAIFETPRNPYTQALLAALPEHNLDRPRLAAIPGVVPGQHDRPAGCLLSPRCRYAVDRCRAARPELAGQPGRQSRCFFPLDDAGRPTHDWVREPGAGRAAAGVNASAPLLEARELARHYVVTRGWLRSKGVVRALDGVSFTLQAGRTLAVVGESGCGKSTLARQVTMIERPTSGALRLDGVDVAQADRATRKRLRPLVQMVFQNPFASLNPRKKIGTLLEEPLAINTPLGGAARRERALAMMAKVGLRQEHYRRYPHMFSGGQRQRIAVARALMLHPRLLVADEPVSALDVSIQAQVLNLLMDLQQEMGIAYLFISHNLQVVRHIADDVLVMYLGKVFEYGPKREVFARPAHPYTRALMASTPSLAAAARRERVPLKGELPSPLNPPPGCPFHRRCPHALPICSAEMPPLQKLGEVRVACHQAQALNP